MIQADGLTKKFGTVLALDNLSLIVRPGEFFSILGPSGCGKTTLLRLLAGLEFPDQGKISINGTDVTHAPAQLRPINTVFQNYALFPHLSVNNNIGFGLRMRRMERDEIISRVSKIMATMQITELGHRMPAQLSGGQKQRVALARALVNQPLVLLLDEPLSALDARLRREMQAELKSVQRQFAMTFIFVTHDQHEALALSDRIALMNKGRLEQIDPPAELYDRPRTEFAARFLGDCNIFSGKWKNDSTFESAWGEFKVHSNCPASHRSLGIRPENILLSTTGTNCNSFETNITSVTFNGSHNELVLSRNEIQARAWVKHQVGFRFTPGQKIYASLPPENLLGLEL